MTYTEKRVSPRIEPCGTPIDCQRSGVHALRFDTLNSVSKVVSGPGEAVIRKTKAIESADKNTVIDRVESLGQVNEDSCTVLYLIDMILFSTWSVAEVHL